MPSIGCRAATIAGSLGASGDEAMLPVSVWAFLAVVVIEQLVLMLSSLRVTQTEPDPLDDLVVVELHAIQRRLDVFQFRVETERDAANVQRQLGYELDDLDQQGRQQ
jgi:hypothetical protein